MQTEFLKSFEGFFTELIVKPLPLRTQPGSAASAEHRAISRQSATVPPISGRDIALEIKGREYAARIGCPKLANSLVVRWSNRLKTTAGLAHPQAKRITLNPRLKQISEDEIQRTLLHELAHLAAHERYPNRRLRAHGPEWRRVCADLGIPGESARHNLPFERRRLQRRFFYICPNCGKRIGRVHKMRRPSACAECCKRFNGGRFDRRFIFIPCPPESALLSNE